MIKFKCQKAVAAMQRLFCWSKLARGKGKVASFEGRDASCRRGLTPKKELLDISRQKLD